MRTPRYLIDIARRFPSEAAEITLERSLLPHAIAGDSSELELALSKEQVLEQKRDKEYWQPLRE